MADPIPWPADIRPSTSSFRLEANTARNESPLSRATQVLVRPGARWRCDMTFNNRNRIVAARVDALLNLLEGSGGEVLLFDFRRPTPRGDARLLTNPITTIFDDGTFFNDGTHFVDAYSAEVPTVAAAAAKGSEFLSTQGWGNNEFIFRAGDYIGLGGYLYMVCADVQTSPLDVGIVQLRPRLRIAAAVNDDITVVQPTCRFRLADNSQGGNATQPMSWSEGTDCTISLTVESRLADLDRARTRRYTDRDQQAEYPGNLGFQFVDSLQDAVI